MRFLGCIAERSILIGDRQFLRGNKVMTSQPVAVTTNSSSMRAADRPSDAGQ